MRVKVGDVWFKAEPGQPVMIEIEPLDRSNIIASPSETTLYACFAEDEPMDEALRRTWMREGSKEPGKDLG